MLGLLKKGKKQNNTITDAFFYKFERKCANNHAHEFLDYITYKRNGPTIADAINQIGFYSTPKPISSPRKINVNKEIAGDLVCEFYAKYLPQKAKQVQQIINQNHPLFLDKSTNTYQIFITDGTQQKVNAVSLKTDKPYLILECNVTPDVEGPRVLAHEVAHAISMHQQHRLKLVKNNANMKEFNQYSTAFLGKDCIGEIESYIIENLFNDFMLKKGLYTPEDLKQYKQEQQNSLLHETNLIREESDIIKNLPCPVTKESLENLQNNLNANSNQILSNRIQKMANEEYSSQYMFRYVVGRVVADVWIKHFTTANKATQQQMLNNFNNYLDNTHNLTLDDACQTLLDEDFVNVAQEYTTKDNSNENQNTYTLGG